jgi:hypothetical protein
MSRDGDVEILDYEGTPTMGDEWHSFEYKGKQYDIHIYFDDIHSFDNMTEWLTSTSVEIYGLLDNGSGTYQIDYDYSVVVPITFAFDPMIIFKNSTEYQRAEYRKKDC